MSLWPQRQILGSIVTADPAMLLSFIRSIALKLLGTVVAVLAVIATADYLFQYRQWYERQKMSLQEIKEEFRQTEGDPTIKGKLRQLRATRMRKRIIAAVPKASVVITNPTHYAIALKYERGMNAPVCVSRGVDLIARKIREVAEEHRIPVVENPPLARALHAPVEIDQEIPQEHYRAVAEIIGYIMRLRRMAARPRSGKVDAGFPKRSCSNKDLERDNESIQSLRALARGRCDWARESRKFACAAV